MEMNPSALWEGGLADFLLVSVALAGAAAWMTGRASAHIWAPIPQLAFYCALLACACRFIHYSLFEGVLLSGWGYLADLAVIASVAFVSRRLARARQMREQYGFAFRGSGPFGWRRRPSGNPQEAPPAQ